MFSGINQPSAAGSLFSSTANPQVAKRGLLDSPTTSQPAKPSPFATTSATLGTGFGAQTSSSTPSIFASAPAALGTGFGAQTSGNTPSIYSNANPTVPTNAPATTPATGFNASTWPSLGSSLLNQQPVQNAQPQLNQPGTAPTSGLASQSTQPAYFSSLLERGKKRPHPSSLNKPTQVELPNLQLGLDDIQRTARTLGFGGAGAGQGDGKP